MPCKWPMNLESPLFTVVHDSQIKPASAGFFLIQEIPTNRDQNDKPRKIQSTYAIL